MAFPSKTNYASGDILTAAQMNDIGSEINALNGAVGKNKIINGDFRIWQRGTSFTGQANGDFSADRWRVGFNGSGATVTTSRQTFTPGTAPVAGYEGQYFLRHDVTVAGTGSTARVLRQYIEDARTFAGQTVTLSFWAKADSTRTVTSGLAQVFGTGGSTAVATTTQANTVTTSWQRFTQVISVPSVAGQTIGTDSYLRVDLSMPVNTTMTIDFWGVQVEAGNLATAFQTATGTLAGELAACQRYFQTVGAGQAWGSFYLTTAAALMCDLPVVMRVNPTPTYNTNYTSAVDQTGVANRTPTAYANYQISTVAFGFTATGMTGGTTGNMAVYQGGNHQLSAEL